MIMICRYDLRETFTKSMMHMTNYTHNIALCSKRYRE